MAVTTTYRKMTSLDHVKFLGKNDPTKVKDCQVCVRVCMCVFKYDEFTFMYVICTV